MSTVEYGNESIELKEGAARVRDNPQNFLGSRGLDGAQHTLYEIAGNCTDEKLSGFGNELDVARYKDGYISFRDYGRGVPLGLNKNYGKYNYYLIYEELFAGGKYGKNQEVLRDINDRNAWDDFEFVKYPYLITIGMNGVGGAATQFTSESFEVISYRNGEASRMYYEKGTHVLDELEVYKTNEPDGTYIKWKPDPEVFDDAVISSSFISGLCETLSFVSTASVPGFTVRFYDEEKGTTTVYEGSTIADEVKKKTGVCFTNRVLKHVVDARGDVCVCEAECAIGKSGCKTQFYNNMIKIHGGSHSNGLNGALYQFFTDIGREHGIKIKESDYSGKLSFIVTTLANKMSIRGQTKDSLDDEYIMIAVFQCVYDALKLEYSKGTGWLTEIIEDVIEACRIRTAQEELIKNNREIERSIKRHKVSSKFISCLPYEKGHKSEVEYIIVEGDSAGGRAATARAKYQCILGIRGKSLNVHKASVDKLVANSEIRDIIMSLGCGIDLGIEGYESFDISKLKVGKIFFLADADIDGKHILMLLFLIFYKLFPELLYQGYVYIIDPPLYTINTKDGRAIYCMDDNEFKEKQEEIGYGNILSTDRFKGLGETSAEDLWNTTLDPEKRHIRQIKLARNDTELVDVIEVLFGKSTERRKRAILGELMEDFDGVMSEIESVSDAVSRMNLDDDLDVEEVLV